MLRLGVPVALIRKKAEPIVADQPIDWRSVREHCELDTLLTALSLIAWRRIQGDPCLYVPMASYSLIEGYLRQRPDAADACLLRRQSAYLENVIADTLRYAA